MVVRYSRTPGLGLDVRRRPGHDAPVLPKQRDGRSEADEHDRGRYLKHGDPLGRKSSRGPSGEGGSAPRGRAIGGFGIRQRRPRSGHDDPVIMKRRLQVCLITSRSASVDPLLSFVNLTHLPSLRPSKVRKAELYQQHQRPTPHTTNAKRNNVGVTEPLDQLSVTRTSSKKITDECISALRRKTASRQQIGRQEMRAKQKDARSPVLVETSAWIQ